MSQTARPPVVVTVGVSAGGREYLRIDHICTMVERSVGRIVGPGARSRLSRRRSNQIVSVIGAIVALVGIILPFMSTADPGFAAPAEQRMDISSCVDRDQVTGELFSERAVLPASVQLCHSAMVSVTVRSTCNTVPMIIMLNMDISASMYGSPLDAAQRAAGTLVSSLDLDANPDTLVGIVIHGREARTLLTPTNKRSLIIGRINSLRSESGDNLPSSIRLADLELSKSAGRVLQRPLEYMVIFSDGGQDAAPDDSIGPARSAGSRGVQIVSICSESFYPPNCGALRDIASEPRLAFDVRDVSRPALHFADQATIARNVRIRSQSIVEHIPPELDYKLATAWPSADYDPLARTLTFAPADPKAGEYQFGYEVKPRVTGPIVIAPVASRFVDTRGLAGSIEVPTTTLTVDLCVSEPAAPSPTPPATHTPRPTDEPTPDSPTPARPFPTASRDYRSAYLPIAIFDCPARRRPVDTVLLVDSGNAADGAPGLGLEASRARDLALRYAATMQPGDRSAVYSVGSEAVRMIGLSEDSAAIHAAIGRLRPHPTSRLDLALDAAVVELESSVAALDHKPVIVVLSSGRGFGTLPGALRDAAWRAQAVATVFSIGIGPGADMGLLILIAGRPSRYADGDDPDAVPAIHRATREIRYCSSGGAGPPGDRPLKPSP